MQTLASVLLPDMLIVQTNKAGNTTGWLTWALANGYGRSHSIFGTGFPYLAGPK